MKKSIILERIFNKCNLEGSEVNIYSIMYQYKTVKNESEKLQEAIYNYIADRMNLSTNRQLTKYQEVLLIKAGY